ncbi:c-type cytochrome [Salipiger mucosus]|uniref:Cytochrome c2 n=1 Tax=Salipiger mucosus DSM 16094 TaxID=1123237 RepID=S9QDX4_9RHOB|nr:c-type cytochrome [Salipiger mucosus]EPX79616.1 Cytochrome c2 [Salipiger mucosus DSM 16094]
MTSRLIPALAAIALAGPALAESHAPSGDAEAGERAFRQCRSCHMIESPDETIVRGGQTGPNLYGVAGRTAGTVEDFRYSDLMVAAGEAGLEWDEESFTGYIQDPTGFLHEAAETDSGRSNMSFQLRREDDAPDLWAYLVSVGPDGDM